MKLTKSQLKQLIKKELSNILNESTSLQETEEWLPSRAGSSRTEEDLETLKVLKGLVVNLLEQSEPDIENETLYRVQKADILEIMKHLKFLPGNTGGRIRPGDVGMREIN